MITWRTMRVSTSITKYTKKRLKNSNNYRRRDCKKPKLCWELMWRILLKVKIIKKKRMNSSQWITILVTISWIKKINMKKRKPICRLDIAFPRICLKIHQIMTIILWWALLKNISYLKVKMPYKTSLKSDLRCQALHITMNKKETCNLRRNTWISNQYPILQKYKR